MAERKPYRPYLKSKNRLAFTYKSKSSDDDVREVVLNTTDEFKYPKWNPHNRSKNRTPFTPSSMTPSSVPTTPSSASSHSYRQVELHQNIDSESDGASIREVDLTHINNSTKPHYQHANRAGPCCGCGMPGASMRAVTNEFLCPPCRTEPRYKLITKTTVSKKYPLVTYKDLINGYQNHTLQCFFVRNWYDVNAHMIKLYYEWQIQQLNQEKQESGETDL